MSKSYKKAIVKDNGIGHKLYRKTVRGSQKNYIRSNMDKLVNDDDFVIPDEKEIMNSYDYCDYICDFEHRSPLKKHKSDEEIEKDRKKYKRK